MVIMLNLLLLEKYGGLNSSVNMHKKLSFEWAMVLLFSTVLLTIESPPLYAILLVPLQKTLVKSGDFIFYVIHLHLFMP